MLKHLIYEHYENGHQYNSRTKKMKNAQIYFNPSSFSACKRQVYFKKIAMKTSNPILTAAHLKMAFGTVLHEYLQSVVQGMGILVEAEKLKVVTMGGLKFRYKTDGIIVINGKRYIMEIKTTHGQGFRMIKDAPKPSDVIQMALYMLFEHVEDAVLLYVGRDNGFLMEYVVKVGDPLYRLAIDTISKKLQELKILEKDIKNRQMPARDCQIALKYKNGVVSSKFQRDKKAYKADWQCEYCQWKDLCWARELEEIKNHKFFLDGKFSD